MPHHAYKTVSGKITHVFGHRFVLKTADSDQLADLTPHGLGQIDLAIGEVVTIEGEMKPTELKVNRLTRAGRSVDIDHSHHHGPHHHQDHHHPPDDPAVAVASAKAAGFAVLGTPRRKPKHFEVLGKRGRTYRELHIELDGRIRKSKPVARDDAKWASDLPGT